VVKTTGTLNMAATSAKASMLFIKAGGEISRTPLNKPVCKSTKSMAVLFG